MNFSLSRVFVVPSTNTLPSSGKTSDLSANQFGVFLPSMAPATDSNSSSVDYLFLAQQRPDSSLNLPTIKSDKIYPGKVIEKYITEYTAGQVKIGKITDFDVSCGETMSVSIRAYEEDVLMSYSDGYTKTFTEVAPCCDCDSDVCASVSGPELQAMVESVIAKINADTVLKTLMTASLDGSGASSGIILTGKAQTEQASADLTVNHYRSNAVDFRAWAYRGAPTTQDAIDFDGCESIGTYTVTQELKYAKGIAAQVALSEYKHFAYTVPNFKERFSDVNYNGIFHSNVVTGTNYDMIVMKVHNPESINTWSQAVNQDFTVIIWSPTTKTSDIVDILEAKYGTFPVI